MEEERVNNNLESISKQIRQIYDSISQDLQKNHSEYNVSIATSNIEPLFVNNYNFYKDMNVLTFLREVGKVLRMNNLLTKEIVSNRLASENGISYTEFSYSILQAYDFYRLHKEQNCFFQFGGSDQWGNITNGCDLIRRLRTESPDSFGLTMPLLLTKSGAKFGKS